MEDNGPTIDEALVRRLVAAQFPQWADLPVRPVAHGGWDNRTFHLGEEMTVRLPSAAGYVQQVEKEHRWLPWLAPQLPLPIPAPIARGEPGEGYPWPWSVYRWIEGETAQRAPIVDMTAFAETLGGFLAALQACDATGGPLPGDHNFQRGGPPGYYDAAARQAIRDLAGEIDTGLAMEVWERALSSRWQKPPVWFHGDMASGNLLVRDGRLSAVIDFGTSGVGDPACDLYIAWSFFDGPSREAFRAALPLDAETWARGRGWTLWKAMITLAGHIGVADPAETGRARHTIDAVLEDHRRAG